MAIHKLNLITPPEQLFNYNPGYLIVKPSTNLKKQVKTFFGSLNDSINVYIYDEHDNDIEWLLACSKMSDIIIIDIDNCDEITKYFISFMLMHPRSFYITNDETSIWKLISKHRIFDIMDLIDFFEEFNNNDQDDDIFDK